MNAETCKSYDRIDSTQISWLRSSWLSILISIEIFLHVKIYLQNSSTDWSDLAIKKLQEDKLKI